MTYHKKQKKQNYLIKLKSISLSLLLLLLIFSFTPVSNADDSVSELESRYQQLRTSYRQLVVTDPGVREIDLWHETKNELEYFLALNALDNNREYRPKALYLIGRLYEQLFIRAGETNARLHAENYFEEIIKDFPEDEFVDDALLALSRIYNRTEKYQKEQEVLETLINQHSRSSLVTHAKKRLDSLRSSKRIKNSAFNNNQDEKLDSVSDFTIPTGSISSLESKYPVVVIDPGHGGIEDGAIGPEEIKEKDIVLNIALLLKKKFLKHSQVRAYLTRNSDEDLSLSDRTLIANDLKASLFVSIHANASPYKTRKGVETYYLDNTNDKSSLRLAERENMTLASGKKDLSFIISDFIQSVKMDDSVTAAHLIQSNLVSSLTRHYSNIKNLGVKKAPFYVLMGAHMPCILVEVSFIDHPVEGRRLATERYQKLIVGGLFDGVMEYFIKKELINESDS